MININNNNVLKDIIGYKDFTFNTIYCDPPYNLGSTWTVKESTGRPIINQPKDFMNKWIPLSEDDWNKFFIEAFRTLKYGGYLIMFGIDRQLFAMQYYAVKNGFEIQQSVYWYFMSNFPRAKSVNIKEFEGYKYSKIPLKQLVETVMVFRKPLKYKTPLEDIQAWNKGEFDISPSCINIDGSRVPATWNEYSDGWFKSGKGGLTWNWEHNNADKDKHYYDKSAGERIHKNGRYPSQVLQDGNIEKIKGDIVRINHTCEYESEELDLFLYEPKPSTTEKTIGLGKEKLIHPTTKPIQLTYRIMQLFKLPDIIDQKVYVPFAGVFSEIIGVYKAGIKEKNIYACELNKKYIQIGKKRFIFWKNIDLTKAKVEGIPRKGQLRLKKNIFHKKNNL